MKRKKITSEEVQHRYPGSSGFLPTHKISFLSGGIEYVKVTSPNDKGISFGHTPYSLDDIPDFSVLPGGKWQSLKSYKGNFTVQEVIIDNTKKKCGVYFILSEDTIKIGWSEDIDRRLLQLQTAQPQPLKVIAWIPTKNKSMESFFHKKFADEHVLGEWFKKCRIIEFLESADSTIIVESIYGSRQNN